jgi:hypothetical protein
VQPQHDVVLLASHSFILHRYLLLSLHEAP